jgi:hypothetical protein
VSRRLSRFDPGWLVAALLPLIGILPTLSSGVIDTADGPLHVQRLYAMGVMLSRGNLWPRWISWFHLGFGYPIFNFYPPGVFYLGGLLTLVGISATAAFTIVGALAWVVGSVGMYGLARRFFPAYAALLSALIWAYAPSRLFEVWDQGSLPQAMASALIPWLLSGIVGAALKPTRRGLLAIALPLAGIVLCHQPITFITALYVAPMSVIVPLWLSRHDWRSFPRRIAFIGGGLVLGVGLASIFLIPLASELRYVQASRGAADTVAYLTSNFLQPDEIFAQPQPADLSDLRYELPTTLGLIGGVLAVPGLIALARRKQFGLLALLLLALGFTLFMLLDISLPVWLGIPFFRQLRFPERFLRMGATILALAGGASILLISKRWQAAALGLVALIVVVAALPMVYPNQTFLQWDNLTARDEIAFELDNATWGTTSYDEFDPIWGEDIPLPINAPEVDEYAANPTRIVVNRVDMARYGDIMQVQQIDTATVKVTLSQDHGVRFHQYYFPGWTARLDGQAAPIRPDDQFGLITVDAPTGEHVISLSYEGTLAQQIGAVVTLVSLSVAVMLLLTSRKTSEVEVMKGTLPPRVAWTMGGAVVGFALVNTFILAPNTLLFRIKSPPDTPAYMQTPVHASFGDTFELLGYTLEQTETAPGDLFNIMLFWRAERDIQQQYRPVVQLVNLTQSAAWAADEPFFPGGGQTVGYPQDKFASDIHEMRVFADAPPYVGRVSVQMVDAETGESLRLHDGADRLILDPLIRIRGEGQPVSERMDVMLGDSVQLQCADVQAGDDGYHVHLFWRVLKPPTQDFVTFVHGLDSNGDQVAQADSPPLGGNYPPSLWLPGQNLSDSYTLPADDVTQVAVGLYTPGDNQRLTAVQNDTPLADNQVIIRTDGAPCQS